MDKLTIVERVVKHIHQSGGKTVDELVVFIRESFSTLTEEHVADLLGWLSRTTIREGLPKGGERILRREESGIFVLDEEYKRKIHPTNAAHFVCQEASFIWWKDPHLREFPRVTKTFQAEPLRRPDYLEIR